MFRIKICGITRPEDALAAAEAGADCIGLNFYEKSKRFVTLHQAASIIDVLPEDVTRFGVFVNHPPEKIAELVDTLSLDGVQLHGDEDAATVAAVAEATYNCRPRPEIVVAWRIGPQTLDELGAAGVMPSQFEQAAGVLLDTARDGLYGGSGATLDWQSLSAWQLRTVFGPRHLLLAGGLTAENIAEAIRIVQPDGVDVASGIESEPGVKDPEKLRAFVGAAIEAFDRF
jgi:phosphoribosylanthranilate isomerase